MKTVGRIEKPKKKTTVKNKATEKTVKEDKR